MSESENLQDKQTKSDGYAKKIKESLAKKQNYSQTDTEQQISTNNNNYIEKIKEALAKNKKNDSNTNIEQDNFSPNTIYAERIKEALSKDKDYIKSNITNVIQQYKPNSVHNDTSQNIKSKNYTEKERIENKNKELIINYLSKYLQYLITICFILIIICIGTAIITKPEVEKEGEKIVKQIVSAEKFFHIGADKYHYFSKTKYDKTLDVDISSCKYFTYYEVLPNELTGNYKVKLYAKMNFFTMPYYYLKILIFK